jgi:hypothetical protein
MKDCFLAGMLLCFCITGCASIKEAWMRSYVAIHDAADDALKEGNKQGNTNTAPDVVKPPDEAAKACTCDLSKPTVWPLAFIGDKAAVDKSLGAADGCGNSGRRDCRAMLMRPDGNTWGYKYVFQTGCLEYSPDGSMIKVRCFEYKGQQYHFVGWSIQESISTMTKAEPGVFIQYRSGGHGMFLFFECR